MTGPNNAAQAPPTNRTFSRTTSKGLQMTLFGDVLPPQASSSKSKSTTDNQSRTKPVPTRNPFGHHARKTKVWDHTEFAKTGWKKSTGKSVKGKGKGKGKASPDDGIDDADEEEEEVEFEQFPAPFVPTDNFIRSWPPPMTLKPDLLEARTWVYPLNQPKREYQFNIVKHCLFENTLVSLPTGLGKTFIAGVVMLNFYRWFPEGKVVFVAPTKPLVAQQIEACHKTCGIPGTDAIQLTGENPQAERARAWEDMRVFYMTPQTLINDLAKEICEPKNIILLVIDEAHKGTGDYAYAQVIRYMMAKNPHFRVLALTATPGSKPETVQAIVDSLHISRIEIRDENSMDLRGYLHKKVTQQHKIAPTEDMIKIRDLLAKIMEDKIKPLSRAGILYGNLDPVMVQPYRFLATASSLKGPTNQWAWGSLHSLSHLARAMGYLLETSIKSCYKCLQETSQATNQDTGKKPSSKKTQSSLRKDPTFQAIIRELEAQHSKGLAVHPKMEKLKMLILEHFVGGNETGEGGPQTRVMVFTTYRDCVDEIVTFLNEESPMVKATKFVGQGTDKSGQKGFGQKEQLRIIQQFKDGHFNVLVATSVGEEGLDIGEVDMVVCYDSQKTPIRMLQRIGRTGRKRDGHIHVLVAESREEANWAKAKEQYQDVQQSIVRGEQLELYGDVERLLPDDIKPNCIEKEMEIVEYESKQSLKARRAGGDSPAKGKKRKRDEDPMKNMPVGASAGFVKVSDLLVKNGAVKKGKKKVKIAFDERAAESDDTDKAIEAGVSAPPRRTVSVPAAEAAVKTKKPRRTKTADPNAGRKKTASKTGVPKTPPKLSLSQKATDDEDDIEIERGLLGAAWKPGLPLKSSTQSPFRPSLQSHPSSPDIPLADQANDTQSPEARHHSPASLLDSPPLRVHRRQLKSPTHSSTNKLPVTPTTPSAWALSGTSPSSPSGGKSPSCRAQSMAWLLDDDDDPDILIVGSSPPASNQTRSGYQSAADDSEIEFIEDELPPSSPPKPNLRGSPMDEPYSSPAIRFGKRPAMGPPRLPDRLVETTPGSISDREPPQPTFAIRAPGNKLKKRSAVLAALDSSPVMSPPSQRRLRHLESPSLDRDTHKVKRTKLAGGQRKANPWMDLEAIHSGDEESSGVSDVDEVESESDRQFLRDSPATQVSPSYDQSAVYRASLMSQAPIRIPAFANPPVRQGGFGGGRQNRLPVVLSSSPRRSDDLPDEYDIGSFVVDDEEVSYLDNSVELCG
ncbi:hypothetical protein JAAARDRAFT_696340 [Jaapia argillacea MUCL 33604]|uniref:ATP-dependent DNA helicase n=1 Tax=Jaapia argillacea MUCL 33604 TaxID=933084 RepID=A0A067QCI5_9AGAM|nr:hypothetical protein JAAARDRAFT_696340 [Jaapia argillacea MUCL 33604]